MKAGPLIWVAPGLDRREAVLEWILDLGLNPTMMDPTELQAYRRIDGQLVLAYHPLVWDGVSGILECRPGTQVVEVPISEIPRGVL